MTDCKHIFGRKMEIIQETEVFFRLRCAACGKHMIDTTSLYVSTIGNVEHYDDLDEYLDGTGKYR